MKRENKFRGWSEKEQCYIVNKVNYLIDFTGAIFYQYGYNLLESVSDLIIEQYTGIKDRNGAEIYDGDIIQFKFRTKTAAFEYIGKIYFDEYMWLAETEGGEIFSLNRIHGIQVIGNIFETPNLLQ